MNKNEVLIKALKSLNSVGAEIMLSIREMTKTELEAEAVRSELIRELENKELQINSKISEYVYTSNAYKIDIMKAIENIRKEKDIKAPLTLEARIKIQIADLLEEEGDTTLLEDVLKRLETERKEKEALENQLKQEREESSVKLAEAEEKIRELESKVENLEKPPHESPTPIEPTPLPPTPVIVSLDELINKVLSLGTQAYNMVATAKHKGRYNVEAEVKFYQELAQALSRFRGGYKKNPEKYQDLADELINKVAGKLLSLDQQYELLKYSYNEERDVWGAEKQHEDLIETLQQLIQTTSSYIDRIASIAAGNTFDEDAASPEDIALYAGDVD